MQPPIITPPIVAAPSPMLSYATPSEFAVTLDWTSVESFTLDPLQQCRHLWVVIPILVGFRLFFLAVAVCTMSFLIQLDLATIGILVPILLLLQLVGVFRKIRQIRRTWPTYRLIIADQGILSRSRTSPLTRINAAEIARITRTWDAYKITLHNGRHLALSSRVLNPERLHAKLEMFRPIHPGRGLLGLAAYLGSVWLTAIASMIVGYVGLFSDKPPIILTCTVLSFPLAAFNTWRVFRIKGLPLRTRIYACLQLVFPFLLLAHWLVLRHLPR